MSDSEKLKAVENVLLMLGFSASDVEQPDACILKLATTQRETDWRDAFMAALAGGGTITGASSTADSAVEILHVRRTGSRMEIMNMMLAEHHVGGTAGKGQDVTI